MTKHEEILSNLQSINFQDAEKFQEELDIIIHKLKFLPQESFPTVVLLTQNDDFEVLYNVTLQEKVSLAGGILAPHLDKATDIILVHQQDNSLYSILPDYISQLRNQEYKAVTNNNLYIIQSNTFDRNDDSYLEDVETLAEIIQPKYFFFDRNGKDWVKFDF